MQIQQDNFIQKLLSLEKGRAYIPDLRKKRTWYLKKLSDAKLVKYIRRGNNQAFDVLIKRHEPKLKEIIRHSLFDKSQREDVLQDVWEMVIPQIKAASPLTPLQKRGERNSRYRENGQFYGWLSTIAYRKTMMVNRKKQYNPEMVEYDSLVHDIEEPADEEPSELILEEVKKIISDLSEADRQIIEMHYKEGLTFEKIAGKMNLTRENVKKRHLRLMNRIRKEFHSRQNLSSGQDNLVQG